MFLRYLLTAFFVAASSAGSGQETSDLAEHPGRWVYSNELSSNDWYGARYYKMNAADLQQYDAGVARIVNYLHLQPVAQKPVGVTLRAKASAAYDQYDHQRYPVKNDERVKARIFIAFCNLISKNGAIAEACDEVPFVEVVTNDVRQVYEPAMNFDILDDKQALEQFSSIFYLPGKIMDLGNGVYLYDWYYKNRIVIARNDKPVWVPVTNKEYIDRLMIYYTAALKEEKIPQMVIDALKMEIAGIPADMMNLPAYLNGNTQRPLTMICRSGEDASSALYKINPAYFDATLQRSAVQLITIAIEGHADNAGYGGLSSHRVWEFISGLKGGDLLKLLDTK